MLNGSADIGPREFALDDMVPEGERSKISPRIVLGDVVRMEWEYFECFVAALWLKRGFKSVYKTPVHDEGVDVVALNGKSGSLIQCKTSSIDGYQLGWDGMRMSSRGRPRMSVDTQAFGWTRSASRTSSSIRTARKHAEMNDVETVDQRDLERLLAAHEVRKLDVESLYAEWDKAA